jgi:DNA helicase-2/ATP-dependent DNA helicase PcrA
MSELKSGDQSLLDKAAPIADHLATLNPQQRKAAEYGIKLGKTSDIGPLLVIAGAGSGKTNTLAHRAAHLLINGADPNASSSSRLREEQQEK